MKTERDCNITEIKLSFHLIQTSINHNLIKKFNLCISIFIFILLLFDFYKKVPKIFHEYINTLYKVFL